jgi:hypothetical protein
LNLALPAVLHQPTHHLGSPLTDLVTEIDASSIDPETAAFVAEIDTAIVKKVFNVTKPEHESDINRHTERDDVGRSLELAEDGSFVFQSQPPCPAVSWLVLLAMLLIGIPCRAQKLLRYSKNTRKRCERPTNMMGSLSALFARALRFGLEQSFGTNGATFVGFGWEPHQPASGSRGSDGSAQLAG